MQEHRVDGSSVLSTVEKRNLFDEAGAFIKAVSDAGNMAVTLHAPGNIVTMPDGRKYRVADDGSWRRV